MKKTVLMVTLFILMTSQNLSAYDLKKNMFWMNSELLNVQQGFMKSNPKNIKHAIEVFSQTAYTNIEHACFHCHNIVRDR